ncbi:nitrate/nitrite transporter [Bacteroides sp. 224]|uniref:MFS transporter n=1 Tax=Bacteroides sp. 224 TaxID=2302936 RepID=UPI0013D5482B|nr:MFS transporter [Bacteroides sp. 224]NDV65090.1 MFS transporter [Bacteroides sp. 224]
MKDIIVRKLNDSKAVRWTVLIVVAFTMFFGYFISDVMNPLMELLQEEYNWSASEYGLFNMAYGWLNVFLFMLIIGGIILDKIGVRYTGIASCILMIIGCGLEYYAVSRGFDGTVFGIRTQVFIACSGFAIFALGIEMAGITVTKVITRWFKGYEMALAMGVQVAIARLGTALAMATSTPLTKFFDSLSAPILLGLGGLCIGLIAYLVFCVMDRKLDASITEVENDEPFKVRDILSVINNKGFWLVAILCVLFYSAVFPFLKYAPSLMSNKYNVDSAFSGLIPSLLPLGTILLTPLFGGIYDKKGKGATIMIIGASMLVAIHALFAAPILDVWWFAAILTILLGVSFSMVPSAMWPSVPKIIPQNQLGTAYALIFWVQNIGLSLVPLLIGWVLDKYCIIAGEGDAIRYDYTIPMILFTCFGLLAVFIALLLKREDRKKGYGLEKANEVN